MSRRIVTSSGVEFPPLTSQALTISTGHASSTVPTRPRRRHSLRDNKWRAIACALVAEVRRRFLSHHSTCQSIALSAGAILTLYPFTPGRAHHGAQPWDSGYPYERRLTEGGLGPLRPSDSRNHGRALARPLHPLCCDPQPPCDDGKPTIAASDRDARARSLRPRIARPERNLRPRAHALCARTETCDHGRAHSAP